MYESFYGLKTNPFRLAPDPHFFFPTSGHKRGLAYLRYGLQQGQGFVAVTGVPGTGKTMLLQTLLAELSDRSTIVATLSSTNLSADDVLRAAADAFGVKSTGANKAELLTAIERFFSANVQSGKRMLLIVDEAQNLPPRSLEELRMLSNFQLGNKALLQIILLGQQQLRQILADPDMEQLSQRIIAACHLQPISAEETRFYIEHRLRLAGWNGDPSITGQALSLIYGCSKGLPRLINVFCERLFLAAYLDEKRVIDGAVVSAVIDELRHEVGGGWDFSQLHTLASLAEQLAPLPDPQCEAVAKSESNDRVESNIETHVPDEPQQPENLKSVAVSDELTEVDRYGRVYVPDTALEPVSFQEEQLNPAAEVKETASEEEPLRETAKVISLPRKRNDAQQFEMPSESSVAPRPSVVKHDSNTAVVKFSRMGLWLGIAILVLVAAGSWWVLTQSAAPGAVTELQEESSLPAEEASSSSVEPVADGSLSELSSPSDPMALAVESSPSPTTAMAEPPLPKELARNEQKDTLAVATKSSISQGSQNEISNNSKSNGNGNRVVVNAAKQTGDAVAKKQERSVIAKTDTGKSQLVPAKPVAAVVTEPKIAVAVAEERLPLETPPEPLVNTAPPAAVVAMSAPKPAELASEDNKKLTDDAKARALTLNDIAFKLEEFYNGGELQSFVGLFANDASADGSQGRKRIARDYRELFESTEMREMKINDLQWQEANGKISGVGDFEVNIWRRGEETPRVSKGKINVVLVDEGGRLVIKRLAHKSR